MHQISKSNFIWKHICWATFANKSNITYTGTRDLDNSQHWYKLYVKKIRIIVPWNKAMQMHISISNKLPDKPVLKLTTKAAVKLQNQLKERNTLTEGKMLVLREFTRRAMLFCEVKYQLKKNNLYAGYKGRVLNLYEVVRKNFAEYELMVDKIIFKKEDALYKHDITGGRPKKKSNLNL